jgi:hypothetical protein
MGEELYEVTDYAGDEIRVERPDNPAHTAAWIRVTGSAAVEVAPDEVPGFAQAMYRAAGLTWPGDHDECHVTDKDPAPLRLGQRVAQLEQAMGKMTETTGVITTALDQITQDMGSREAHLKYHDSLTSRLDNLEQTSAGGAATDDMFAAQSRRIGQLEERLRVLSAAHDTDADMEPSEEHRSVIQLLTEIRDRLPEPAPPACGAPDAFDTHRCEQPAGHTDRHRDGVTTWPNHQAVAAACGLVSPGQAHVCGRNVGHVGAHGNAYTSWPRHLPEESRRATD